MKCGFILGIVALLQPVAAAIAGQPSIADDRLELKLFAENPEIVTPIGMVIDSHDRIYVLESHTHSPAPDYAGPKGDIIKGFEDADNDGKPDRTWHFAEGIQEGMNLALSPEGKLFAVCAREVWAFEDNDGDGVSESRRRIIAVETANKYPHSCQLGITFSRDGWLYISRGNNGSAAYTITGTDGSKLEGYGDGGSIYRCRPDGSKLEEVATGFWNPFDIKFDSYGRLLAVDNDPDARGPNRLVHVVEAGDYGYKSIYGHGGNHPFQGWDGTLPGTLGYVDSAGEAPAGLIDANLTSFPIDYRDQYLVSIWNENAIARYVPTTNGVSIKATHSVWIQGDQNFRPVALATDSRGNLFITDWMLVAYPVHGHGRIWRVSMKTDIDDGVKRLRPRKYFDAPLPNPGAEEFEKVLTETEPRFHRRLERTLASDDPFLRHAAVVALSRPAFLEYAVQAMYDANPRVRLGALLAMQRGGIFEPQLYARRLLGDPDETVRRAALIWAGDGGMISIRKDLDKAIAFDEVSAPLFETWVAAVEALDPDYVKARKEKAEAWANRLRRKLDANVLLDVLKDEQRPDRVRALALVHFPSIDDAATQSLLREFAQNGKLSLQIEAIRSLSTLSKAPVELFLEIAEDTIRDPNVRAEALLALSRETLNQPAKLLPLLTDQDPAVRREAMRTLRFYADRADIKPTIEKLGATPQTDHSDEELRVQIEFALSPSTVKRPVSIEEWERALANGGDPKAGERVFFSPSTQCAGCHLINHRGRRIGPELSNVGQSTSRAQIIHSILRPSDQFPPQYQAWFVELKNGDYFQGLQLDHRNHGDIELYTTEGITRHFNGPDVERYGVLQRSLMPDGLEQTMTVSELRDLVAFLASLK
ncbi:c-type cytochrome [bacterium]|nr:c-type cytochrome [bacterium]